MSNVKYKLLLDHITKVLDDNIEDARREMDRKIDQEYDARQDFEGYKKARELKSQWEDFIASYEPDDDD